MKRISMQRCRVCLAWWRVVGVANLALLLAACGGGDSGELVVAAKADPQAAQSTRALRLEAGSAVDASPKNPLSLAMDPLAFNGFIGKPGASNPAQVPVDVSADGFGNVYEADLLHSVVRKYDANGQLLLTVPAGAAQGIANTRSLTVDPAGYIYVGDSSTSATSTVDRGAKIVKFDPLGTLMGSWAFPVKGLGNNGSVLVAASWYLDAVGLFDLAGNPVAPGTVGGPGITRDPGDAAIAPDGTIYTTNGIRKVLAFSPTGQLLRTYDKSKGFDFETVPGLAVDSQGNLFATNRRNSSIVKISPTGVKLGEVGAPGHGPGRFVEPNGLTVDAFDNVWVGNYHGHNVQKFDNNLNYLLTIEGDDTALGEFAVTHGMGVDSRGHVYVADMWNNRVSKFDNSGNFITAWGRRGTGDGALFNFPRFLSVDAHDNVYVASDGDIRKFDRHGNYITRWGAQVNGETTCAYTRCARGMAFDAAGNIYVSKLFENRIVKIDAATGALTSIGSKGKNPGQFIKPWGVAIKDERLYVADSGNSRVQILGLDGQFISSFGIKGTTPGKLKNPTAIAVDALGRIYVGDSGNGRIQVFDSSGTLLTQWGTPGAGAGQFTEIHAMALDPEGNLFASDWLNTTAQKFGTRTVVQAPVSVDGRPDFQQGVDRAVFVWREQQTNRWQVRISGAAGQHFIVRAVSNMAVSQVAGVNLTPGSLAVQEFGWALTASPQAAESGLSFEIGGGADLALSVEIDGQTNPGMLLVGAARADLKPAGWILDAAALPALPTYERRVDEGIFVGRTPAGTIDIGMSSATQKLLSDVRLSGSARLTESSGISIDLDDGDQLTLSDNSIAYLGTVLNGFDGFTTRAAADSLIYIALTVNGKFLPHYLNATVNPNSFGLGMPNAFALPLH